MSTLRNNKSIFHDVSTTIWCHIILGALLYTLVKFKKIWTKIFKVNLFRRQKNMTVLCVSRTDVYAFYLDKRGCV